MPRPLAVNPRFGAELRRLRTRHGMTLRQLAVATRYSHTYLWELETGRKRPGGAEVAERLDAALASDGTLTALVTEGPLIVGRSPGTEDEPSVRVGDRADPRPVGVVTSKKPYPIAARPTAIEWDELLAHLAEQWHVLVRTDNLLGPSHALPGVQTQLDALAELLDAEPGDQRTETLRLAAWYAESAAWLRQEIGDLDLARSWTSQAMEWAYETGDHAMVAWSAYRRSQQLMSAGRPYEAVGLVRAARRDNEDRFPGPMRAAVRVQEACAMAATGGGSDALRLLDAAHNWAANGDRGDARDGHGSFCTPGYIEVHRAVCLRLSGRPAEAVAVFERAMPAIPTVYRRDRAAALTGKAAAHLAAREPELAASTAHTALPIARRAGSQRIVRQIAALGAALQPDHRLEPVAALLADLAEHH